METAIDERELIAQLREARKEVTLKEESLKHAEQKLNEIESKLIESMQARGAESTAKYEGLGRAILLKPRLYASYRKENEEAVFEFLKSVGREDLMKLSVHPSSLSGFVKEKVEQGESVPDCITYYLKQGVRFDAA
jgi:exonuclease VII large subunit